MRLLKQSSSNGSTPVLKELIYHNTIPAASQKTITLEAFNQFDLRTIYAKSGTPDNISIQVIDGLSTKNIIYQSNNDTAIYDIINIPILDKDQNQSLNFVVTNTGLVPNEVYIKFQITSLG